MIENTDNTAPSAPRAKIHITAYILAAVSFIPLLGLPFGLAALIWGILERRKRGAKIVALIASAGMLCTVAIYGALFYFGFVQRGGVYDEMRRQLAVNTLSTLVSEVEFYRLHTVSILNHWSSSKNPSRTNRYLYTIQVARL